MKHFFHALHVGCLTNLSNHDMYLFSQIMNHDLYQSGNCKESCVTSRRGLGSVFGLCIHNSIQPFVPLCCCIDSDSSTQQIPFATAREGKEAKQSDHQTSLLDAVAMYKDASALASFAVHVELMPYHYCFPCSCRNGAVNFW